MATCSIAEPSAPSGVEQPRTRTQRRRAMTFIQPRTIARPPIPMALSKARIQSNTTQETTTPTLISTPPTTDSPKLERETIGTGPLPASWPLLSELPSLSSIASANARIASHVQRSKHRPSWSVCTLSTLHEAVGMESANDTTHGQTARVTSRRLTGDSRHRPLSFDVDNLPISQPVRNLDVRGPNVAYNSQKPSPLSRQYLDSTAAGGHKIYSFPSSPLASSADSISSTTSSSPSIASSSSSTTSSSSSSSFFVAITADPSDIVSSAHSQNDELLFPDLHHNDDDDDGDDDMNISVDGGYPLQVEDSSTTPTTMTTAHDLSNKGSFTTADASTTQNATVSSSSPNDNPLTGTDNSQPVSSPSNECIVAVTDGEEMTTDRADEKPSIPTHNQDNPTKPALNSRLVSLDVMRGLTICLMIIANYQITENAFPYLQHASWTGFTIADSVFPNFLFVMGLAIPLASRRLKGPSTKVAYRIAKRTVILFLLGMFINSFPFNSSDLSSTWRAVGVLQRLAIAYAVCTVTFLLLRPMDIVSNYAWQRRWLFNVFFPVGALVLWLGLAFGVDVPGCGRGQMTMECATESYFDTAIFGQSHNYQQKPFDPEGSLSHVTATLNCYLGLRIGISVVRHRALLSTPIGQLQRVSEWSLLAFLAAITAYLFNPVIPIGKPLWTPTFVLLSSAISLVELAALVYIIDFNQLLQSTERLTKPLRWIAEAALAIGKNPLFIYVLSELVAAALGSIPAPSRDDGTPRNAWSIMFEYLLNSWLPIYLDSLIWSLIWVAFIYTPIAIFLDRRGWYLRI